MSQRILKITLLLLIVSSSAIAQKAGFTFRSPIEGIQDQWHSILLPDSIFGKLKTDFADLRILGINANNDTVEAPFIIRQQGGEQHQTEVHADILNQSQLDGSWFFTLQPKKAEIINQIRLQFSNENFDWKLKLEGSQDMKEWYTVLEDYRILSIKNEYTYLFYTTVNFPASRYKYYRVSINSNEKPVLSKASLLMDEREAGNLKRYAISSLTISENKTTNETVISYILPYSVPVSRIRLQVKDSIDFFRPVQLSVLEDSVATEKGWQYHYQLLHTGIFQSGQINEWWIQNRMIKQGTIRITNRNDQPLKADSVVIEGYEMELVTRFNEKANYWLYYGHKTIGKPVYDIANFKDKIPVKLNELNPGAEQKIAPDPITQEPLFTNKFWLWIILILLIGFMGGFTLIMIKRKN